VTRGQFTHRVFKALGISKTLHNRRAFAAWMQAEGGSAHNNPLNSTEDWPGATLYNGVGVKNYPSADAGVEATVKTFHGHGHGYEAILRALRRNAPAADTLAAVAASDWGTGPLPETILGEIHDHPERLRELERVVVAS